MILTVVVKPNSHETKIIAWKDAETVIIAIAEPAAEGKANKALIDFLSKKLRIAKSLIEIKRGKGARVKHIKIPSSAELSHIQNRSE